jgi:hypothetical protein
MSEASNRSDITKSQNNTQSRIFRIYLCLLQDPKPNDDFEIRACFGNDSTYIFTRLESIDEYVINEKKPYVYVATLKLHSQHRRISLGTYTLSMIYKPSSSLSRVYYDKKSRVIDGLFLVEHCFLFDVDFVNENFGYLTGGTFFKKLFFS